MPEIDTKITYRSNMDLLDTELYKLTEEQYEAMQGLEENSKLYVKGPAGTGKTILASKFVKSLLKKKNIGFQEIDVDFDYKKKVEMIHKSNGRTSVPQIFFGDEHIGGCDDLFELDKRNELDNL